MPVIYQGYNARITVLTVVFRIVNVLEPPTVLHDEITLEGLFLFFRSGGGGGFSQFVLEIKGKFYYAVIHHCVFNGNT